MHRTRRSRLIHVLLLAAAAPAALLVPPGASGAAPVSAPADARDLVEQQALALVEGANAVVNEDGTACPPSDLVVSWVEPDVTRYVVGGHLTPVGPAPSEGTDSVAGVVLCQTSHHSYAGFDAWQEEDGWRVVLVPSLGPDDGAGTPTPAPTTFRTLAASSGTFSWAPYGSVESYPTYDAQDTCSPTEKPGTVRLRSFLLDRYPGTGNLGIVRSCTVGGTSEHKEGRAFDWAVNAFSSQRAAADDFLKRLMLSDSGGELHATARRIGVMYAIWDSRIWGSYRTESGWREYAGPNPHTDHVHISLSEWAAYYGDPDQYPSQVKSFYEAYEDWKGNLAAMWPAQDPVLSRLQDVPAFSLFVPEISFMVATGLSTGYRDGTWRPTSPMTRSAMAAFLWREAGSPPGPFPAEQFSDIDAHTPFKTAIEWMVSTGATTGYSDGTFRPTATVSRMAMTAFLWRLSGSPQGPFRDPGYSDVDDDHPFVTAIEWASAEGIVDGYDDGTFGGARPTTRQAMAAFIHRWISSR